MGRARKPTELRLIEGTRDRRGKGAKAGEPVPRNPLGDPPAGMTAREKVIWNNVGNEMPPGLLKSVDEYVLTAFCRAVAIADEATEYLRNPPWVRVKVDVDTDEDMRVFEDDPPLLAKTPNGFLQANAYLSIINRQAVIIKTLGAELGLSPASRTRIASQNDDEGDDPNAHYFT